MEQLRKQPYIVGVGAANTDVHWQSFRSLRLRDSNPGAYRITVGGVTRNVLENLSRLDVPVSLLSAVGDDANAEFILQKSRDAGIDVSRVARLSGTTSSTYTAIMDDAGDMLLGLSDMRIINGMPLTYIEEHREFLSGASAVVCDGALPLEVLRCLKDYCTGPLCIDPVSTAYAEHVAPVSGLFNLIKPNVFELAALTGTDTSTDDGIRAAADKLISGGTERVAVSLGERGCYYADRSGLSFFRSLPPLPEMADATGAGDAFLAGYLLGHFHVLSPQDCILVALAAGRIGASSKETVNPAMSSALIEKTLLECGCNSVLSAGTPAKA